MKLPLMAAWATLSLWGSAFASPSSQTGDDTAAQGSPEATPAPQTRGAPQVNEDAPSWLRPGASGQRGTGTGGSGFEGDTPAPVITGEEGMGGSGGSEQGTNSSTDFVSAPPGTSLSGTRGNEGAHFDITPDSWDRNKTIGTDRARPTTGTPPVEGSGGASGR